MRRAVLLKERRHARVDLQCGKSAVEHEGWQDAARTRFRDKQINIMF